MEPDTPPTKTVIRDETVIWRYMDFPKFFATLYKRGLWFAKATTLHDDPWEGFGKAKYLKDPPGETWPKEPGETREVSLQLFSAQMSQRFAGNINNAPSQLYMNCWCWGPESMAMWDIYGSHGTGVALRSSVGQYKTGGEVQRWRPEC